MCPPVDEEVQNVTGGHINGHVNGISNGVANGKKCTNPFRLSCLLSPNALV
jgi:hypothetical protein